jgi:hypothetical protein
LKWIYLTATATGKVLFSEPKDEIELEKPKAKEEAVEICEETVNDVA